MTTSAEPRRENILLSRLRPTQLTVGMLEVKHKRLRLRTLEKRPGELVNFILEMPIRVVLGPRGKAYVIDHHHLALALLKERFLTAPVVVEADFEALTEPEFWKRMHRRKFLHLYNARGHKKPLAKLPRSIKKLRDDPYRSLAGFVRAAGGFVKTPTPFAEFLWADFFRERIGRRAVRKHFLESLARARSLALSKAAAHLPGYIQRGKRSGR